MPEQSLQLVSCIMPTYNRREFVPLAIRHFLRQDYPERELIIIDDGSDNVSDLVPTGNGSIRYIRTDRKITIGAKRNIACQEAEGEIILHWDDDDWIAPWRIGYQLKNLLEKQADICGLDRILFYELHTGKSWQYMYPGDAKPWLAGGTLCYTKKFWKRNPFPDISVGEDGRFIWSNVTKKIEILQDNNFYVALIHPGNTSPKCTTDIWWQGYPTENIRKIIGDEWKNFKPGNGDKHPRDLKDLPLVSCIMPTYNRRKFLPHSIRYFMRQDYPNAELIVVDDGTNPVKDLLPPDSRIRYIRLHNRHSLGNKRNIACNAAKGEIIIFWDDDDWYAPNRISYQVSSLLNNKSKVTGIGKGLFFSIPTGKFWTTTDQLHERMFYKGIISGTMAFWKDLWSQGVRFHDISLADDAAFLKELVYRGIHLEKLENNGIFIYVRHMHNTWQFNEGDFLDSRGWLEMERPSFICDQDIEFFGIFKQPGYMGKEKLNEQKPKKLNSYIKRPMVSCILATGNREIFLHQSIKYFMRQTYENRELVVVDDGVDKYEKSLLNDKRIKYIKLSARTPLGTKLNIGIETSRGEIIQKMDDDDYYHPEFLNMTVSALTANGHEDSIVGFDCFLILIAATLELKFSGYGWHAGGTLCFHKKTWGKMPFRNEEKAVDWWFLKDHTLRRIKIQNPELYILLRHNHGHLWTNMGELDVTEYFHCQGNYFKELKNILSQEDSLFYEKLHREGLTKDG